MSNELTVLEPSYVEGLGDEEIPWWIAPYVRDFVGLAKSTALAAVTGRAGSNPMPGSLRILSQRIASMASVARAAALTPGGTPLMAGVNAAIRAEIEEYCGTPPRPHRLTEAALVLSLVAASLSEKDAAKGVLVDQVAKLQQAAVKIH
jgi:hypothetical protein